MIPRRPLIRPLMTMVVVNKCCCTVPPHTLSHTWRFVLSRVVFQLLVAFDSVHVMLVGLGNGNLLCYQRVCEGKMRPGEDVAVELGGEGLFGGDVDGSEDCGSEVECQCHVRCEEGACGHVDVTLESVG